MPDKKSLYSTNFEPGFGFLILFSILMILWLAVLFVIKLSGLISWTEVRFIVGNTGLIMLFGGCGSLIIYGLIRRTAHRGPRFLGGFLLLGLLFAGSLVYTLFETTKPELGFFIMAFFVHPLALQGFLVSALIPYLFFIRYKAASKS